MSVGRSVGHGIRIFKKLAGTDVWPAKWASVIYGGRHLRCGISMKEKLWTSRAQNTALWSEHLNVPTLTQWYHRKTYVMGSIESIYHQAGVGVAWLPKLQGVRPWFMSTWWRPLSLPFAKVRISLKCLYHHKEIRLYLLLDIRPRNPTYYAVITKHFHQWSTMYQVTRIAEGHPPLLSR